MAKKGKQATPEAEKEFTLTEIRAANVEFDRLTNPNHELITTDARVGNIRDVLARIPEALTIEEPTDVFLVQRLFVNAYLALDLAAKSAGVNLNQSIPLIFNEENDKRKTGVELEYV